MRAQDRKIRNSLRYKIKMWFFRLTFQDIQKGIKISWGFIIEILTAIIGFIFLFIVPALLH